MKVTTGQWFKKRRRKCAEEKEAKLETEAACFLKIIAFQSCTFILVRECSSLGTQIGPLFVVLEWGWLFSHGEFCRLARVRATFLALLLARVRAV